MVLSCEVRTVIRDHESHPMVTDRSASLHRYVVASASPTDRELDWPAETPSARSEGHLVKLSEEEKESRAVNRRRKAALTAEADAIRREDKQREWAENGTRLTRAELEAGVACRGCGLPTIDGLGDRPALMKMTDEEQLEREAAEAAFTARHPNCHASRWTMSGSRTTHCGYCCPPPPLSKKQMESIQSIFKNAGRPDPAELDTWRLSLTCEHLFGYGSLQYLLVRINHALHGVLADTPHHHLREAPTQPGPTRSREPPTRTRDTDSPRRIREASEEGRRRTSSSRSPFGTTLGRIARTGRSHVHPD